MVVLTELAVTTPGRGSTDCAAWVSHAQLAYNAAAATITGVPLSDVWSTCTAIPGNSSISTQGSIMRAGAAGAKAAAAAQLLVDQYVRVPNLAAAVAMQARMASQVISGGFQRQVAAAGGASAARYVAKPAHGSKPACVVGMSCIANATIFGDPHIRRGAPLVTTAAALVSVACCRTSQPQILITCSRLFNLLNFHRDFMGKAIIFKGKPGGTLVALRAGSGAGGMRCAGPSLSLLLPGSLREALPQPAAPKTLGSLTEGLVRLLRPVLIPLPLQRVCQAGRLGASAHANRDGHGHCQGVQGTAVPTASCR